MNKPGQEAPMTLFHADTSALKPGDSWMEGKNIDQSGQVWKEYEDRPMPPELPHMCWISRDARSQKCRM